MNTSTSSVKPTDTKPSALDSLLRDHIGAGSAEIYKVHQVAKEMQPGECSDLSKKRLVELRDVLDHMIVELVSVQVIASRNDDRGA